nr:MAG TPA: hypothetical protein [Caudoviricetes sp.]
MTRPTRQPTANQNSPRQPYRGSRSTVVIPFRNSALSCHIKSSILESQTPLLPDPFPRPLTVGGGFLRSHRTAALFPPASGCAPPAAAWP